MSVVDTDCLVVLSLLQHILTNKGLDDFYCTSNWAHCRTVQASISLETMTSFPQWNITSLVPIVKLELYVSLVLLFVQS